MALKKNRKLLIVGAAGLLGLICLVAAFSPAGNEKYSVDSDKVADPDTVHLEWALSTTITSTLHGVNYDHLQNVRYSDDKSICYGTWNVVAGHRDVIETACTGLVEQGSFKLGKTMYTRGATFYPDHTSEAQWTMYTFSENGKSYVVQGSAKLPSKGFGEYVWTFERQDYVDNGWFGGVKETWTYSEDSFNLESNNGIFAGLIP